MMEINIKEDIPMERKFKKKQKNIVPKQDVPSVSEIEKNRQEGNSWCRKERKFVYDPKKRISCPFCGGKLR